MFMPDINLLLKLNVELEGLLKVLLERQSDHVLEALSDRFAEYSTLFNELLETKAVALNNDAASQCCDCEEDIKTEEVEQSQLNQDAEFEEDLPELSDMQHQEESPITIVEPSIVVPKPQAEYKENTVLKAFTLNDKFRFIREVFNGNEHDFNDTLGVISEMDSYAEAAEYVYNEMMLDADNAVVAEFMAILNRNMPA